MNEELQRILRMVQQGKLTPEQAQMLIEALMAQPRRKSKRQEEVAFEEAMEQLRRAFQGVDWRRIQQEWRRISDEIREQTRRGWEEAQRAFRGMGRWDIDLRLGSVQDVEFDQTIDIPAGARLIVQNVVGDVYVRGQEGVTQMRVRAEGAIRAESGEQAANAWAPILEQRGDVVFVRLARAGKFASADVDITVPSGVSVEIQSTTGDVMVEDTKAAVSVESASGDVKVRTAAGKVRLISVTGDLLIQGCTAESMHLETQSGDIRCVKCVCSGAEGLRARTASGDITVEEIKVQQVSLTSSSGDIRLEFGAPFQGEAHVQTASGDVAIGLPSGSSCQVRVISTDGEVQNQLGIELTRNERGEWEGTLGTAAEMGTLVAKTIRGDVSLRTL
jgi:DUF4097 and DUF4098 domain-containing protein YvlB